MNEWPACLPTLPEFLAAARQHGWKGVFVAALLFAATVVGILSLPRQYVSEAKLFVRMGHQSLTLDPTVTTGQTVSIYETRESEINSLMEILKSRDVLLGVVDQLGVPAILHGEPVPLLPPLTSFDAETEKPLLSRSARTFNRDEEEAVLQLEKMLQVWTPKRTNIIALGCRAESPQLAQAVVNALLRVYRDVHADVNRTPGSYAFFVAQEKLLHARWEEAAHAFTLAKNRHGIASLEAKKIAQQRQLGDVEEQLKTNRVDVATAQARIAAMQEQMKTVPRMAETSRLSSVADGVRTSLFALQSRQQELLARYTREHPLVKIVEDQIAALEDSPAAVVPGHAQTTRTIHPAWLQLETNILVEEARLVSLEAKQTALAEQRLNLASELAACNHAEAELVSLQQQTDVAAQSLRETSLRLEQARLHKELADDRISNLNVVQPASFQSRPVAPKRSLLLALGALVALGGGVLFVAAHAFFRRYLPSLRAVSQLLDIPVLDPEARPLVSRAGGSR